MKRLGLISVLGLALLAAPGAALASGWAVHGRAGYGGGHVVAPAPPRVYVAPATRIYATPGTRVYAAPGWRAPPVTRYAPVRAYAPAHARVWVPGYWGLHGNTRVWVSSNWTLPPFAGWFWVTPQWAWNGYQWVWQEGYWAPPAY